MNEVITEKVKAKDFANVLGYRIVYGEEQTITLNTVNISRPGLFLAGFMDYFGENRVQVFGNAEIEYIKKSPSATEHLKLFVERRVPCIVVARGRDCLDLLPLCEKYKIPLFSAQENTTTVINNLIIYLNRLLAPSISLHGGLVDVFGLGVMIKGKSGIGKSETALELVKHGHRLVADDLVLIKNINSRLFGTSPEIIRYFMEIRGVGIIDIRSIYGVGAIMEEKSIGLVVELEHWVDGKTYDRLGVQEDFEEILDVTIPKLKIPVRPGRNLATIIEIAARNHRLKQQGYNAAKEIISRTL